MGVGWDRTERQPDFEVHILGALVVSALSGALVGSLFVVLSLWMLKLL